jgi:predicted TIM-barrel fold metal-dependent hydrolase
MTFTPVYNAPKKRVKKIALEEHFVTPALAVYANELGKSIAPEPMQYMKERLVDFDNLRLEEMDKYGIDISVLSVTTPGVQVEPDRNVAVRKAKEANDILAKVIPSDIRHAMPDSHISRCRIRWQPRMNWSAQSGN